MWTYPLTSLYTTLSLTGRTYRVNYCCFWLSPENQFFRGVVILLNFLNLWEESNAWPLWSTIHGSLCAPLYGPKETNGVKLVAHPHVSLPFLFDNNLFVFDATIQISSKNVLFTKISKVIKGLLNWRIKTFKDLTWEHLVRNFNTNYDLNNQMYHIQE